MVSVVIPLLALLGLMLSELRGRRSMEWRWMVSSKIIIQIVSSGFRMQEESCLHTVCHVICAKQWQILYLSLEASGKWPNVPRRPPGYDKYDAGSHSHGIKSYHRNTTWCSMMLGNENPVYGMVELLASQGGGRCCRDDDALLVIGRVHHLNLLPLLLIPDDSLSPRRPSLLSSFK